MTLKYNHYTHALETANGSVATRAVDDLFSLSFGFKGNYTISLRPVAGSQSTDSELPRLPVSSGVISGLVDGGVYVVEVDEDATLVRESKPYVRNMSSLGPLAPRREHGAVAALTGQLKALDPADLAARTREYQDLVEARDLEDILFSSN